MRRDVRQFIVAALVLVCGSACLAACGSAHRETLEKAAAEAQRKVNAYCDARQKAIEALGADDAVTP